MALHKHGSSHKGVGYPARTASAGVGQLGTGKGSGAPSMGKGKRGDAPHKPRAAGQKHGVSG